LYIVTIRKNQVCDIKNILKGRKQSEILNLECNDDNNNADGAGYKSGVAGRGENGLTPKT
jgi:hypothetical protein